MSIGYFSVRFAPLNLRIKMTNNEILKSVRYILHLKNAEVVETINSVGLSITIFDVVNMLKNDDDDAFLECSPETLHAFLDGIILRRRGPNPNGPGKSFPTNFINNNIVLRKLRIAFELKDTDMIAILKGVKFNVTKGELGALFRNKDHKNFVKCGDQFLRNFLKGLAHKYRKTDV